MNDFFSIAHVIEVHWKFSFVHLYLEPVAIGSRKRHNSDHSIWTEEVAHELGWLFVLSWYSIEFEFSKSVRVISTF